MTQSLTFETLYARYQPLVRRRLQALLTCYPNEVEDAVQDTFVKAWRALDRVDPDSNVQAWMMRIATNTALDLMRSPRFKRCQSLDSGWENDNGVEQPLAHLLPDRHDWFEALETSETMTHLFRCLPLHYQTVLLLTSQGYNTHELAAILHLKMSTVKSLLFRARQAAQEHWHTCELCAGGV